MKEILKMNMCKVYVNYKSLFTERQCYIFVSVALGSCAEFKISLCYTSACRVFVDGLANGVWFKPVAYIRRILSKINW